MLLAIFLWCCWIPNSKLQYSSGLYVLQSLSGEYDSTLEIVKVEKRGSGAIIEVKIPGHFNQEKLKETYYDKYNNYLKFHMTDPKKELKSPTHLENVTIHKGILIAGSDNLSNTTFNVANQGDINMNSDQSRNITISGGTVNASGAGALGLGDINGTVANTINQLPDSPKPDEPGIKELLVQLQAAIEADTTLSEDDKKDALEQVGALAEAGKNPQEGAMQKAARTAIKVIKGTITSLPSAATLVESCNKLLPLISSLLGIG